MTVAITTTAEMIGEGDTIVSPISGKKMLVKKTEFGIFGLIDLTCLDIDGERCLLTLKPDEEVKVMAE